MKKSIAFLFIQSFANDMSGYPSKECQQFTASVLLSIDGYPLLFGSGIPDVIQKVLRSSPRDDSHYPDSSNRRCHINRTLTSSPCHKPLGKVLTEIFSHGKKCFR